MSDTEFSQSNKPHRKKKQRTGSSSKRQRGGDNNNNNNDDQPRDDDGERNNNNNNNHKDDEGGDDFAKSKRRNPRAFALQSFVAAERQFRRTQDIKAKRLHVPEVDRAPIEPPPIFVAIVGPPKCGKTTLMQNLIRNYTRQKINDIRGPVTVVAGKQRRLTFYECPNDLMSMIDTAKVADLVLLMIDASFGFEMETFEFLNICQVHGFPRIIGILTHMDLIGSPKHLKKTKKKLKHRFWTEIYQGAKLFYLTGLYNNDYRKHEIHNLARFISVMKFKDLGFRLNHSFVVADRYEDLTQPDEVRKNAKCDRHVCFYGYVRGCALKRGANVHIPGCGDFTIGDVCFLADPCELPSKEKKRTLDDRERLLYAPMSGVGGIVYDKDAVYIELGGSHSHSKIATSAAANRRQAPHQHNELIGHMLASKTAIDQKLTASHIELFSGRQLTLSDEQSRPTEQQQEESSKRKLDSDDENDDEDDDDEKGEGTDEDEDDDDDEESIEDEDDADSEDDEDGEEEEEDDDDDDDEEESSKWKRNLKSRASLSFQLNHAAKKVNWEKLIYSNGVGVGGQAMLEQSKKSSGGVDASSDGLFTIRRSATATAINGNGARSIVVDATRVDNAKYESNMNEWTLATTTAATKEGEDDDDDDDNDEGEECGRSDAFESIRDCFVTGKWSASQDAAHLLEQDAAADDDDDDVFGGGGGGGDDDEELYGDFEDFETGQKVTGADKSDDDDDDDDDESGDETGGGEGVDEKKKTTKRLKSEMSKRERLMAKKRRAKAQFDATFDAEKSGEAGGSGESAYYDALEREASTQSQLNRLELERMADEERVTYEGFRAGMYVRVEIARVPCELVDKFDARKLLVVGSLSSNEANVGYQHVRLKKHRWHAKILKNADPLIVSLGWRRFQTRPVYFVQEHNMRNRALKYTPQHMYCQAAMWGPITPQNTGFLAVQTLSNEARGFRIAATGVTIDVDKSTRVVKKLKLVGTPLKIFRKTAFVQGMFTSTLEASKFEGASVKTVSGIRGQIKKALAASSAPPGSVRATFEDKILASDTIFLKTWYAVDVPKFYYPITNLLVDTSQQLVTLKTLGTLKRERNIQVVPDANSLYKPIERTEKFFAPLKINRKLEEQLPFKFKSREASNVEPRDVLESQRVAVIKQPNEAKLAGLMKMFKQVHEVRVKKQHEAHVKQATKHRREMEKIEGKRLEKSKEMRKQVYRRLGKQEKRKTKWSQDKDD